MTGRRVARAPRYARRRAVALVVLVAAPLVVTGWVHERLPGTEAVAVTGSDAAAPARAPSPGPPPTSSPARSSPSRSASPSSAPARTSASTSPSAGRGPTASARALSDPANPWVIVNKAHPIVPIDYVPASLTTVAGKQVATAVAGDLRALLADAQDDGVHLTLASAYRSYTYQRGVHDRLVAQQGRAQADTVSARPGYSEHQTGFAVDFGSSTEPACTLKNCFAHTVEGRWLEAHAGQYGFLHRYTATNTAVTGYAAESWHYRWVGRSLTAAMAAKRVTTLEKYFGVTGGAVYASPPAR